jgi:hypothetical protein
LQFKFLSAHNENLQPQRTKASKLRGFPVNRYFLFYKPGPRIEMTKASTYMSIPPINRVILKDHHTSWIVSDEETNEKMGGEF